MKEKSGNKYTVSEMTNLYSGDPKLSSLCEKYSELESEKLTRTEQKLIEKYKKIIEENAYDDPSFVLSFASAYSEIMKNIEDLSDPKIRKEKVEYCTQLIEKAYAEMGDIVLFARLMHKTRYPESYKESIDKLLADVEEAGMHGSYLIYRYDDLIMEAINDTNYYDAIQKLFAYFQKDDSFQICVLIITHLWKLYYQNIENDGDYLDEFIMIVARTCYDHLIKISHDNDFLIDQASFMKLNGKLHVTYSLLNKAIKKKVPSSKLHLAATYLHSEFDPDNIEESEELINKMYELISDASQDEIDKYIEDTFRTYDISEPNLVNVIKTIHAQYQIWKNEDGCNNLDNIRELLLNGIDAILIKEDDEWLINPVLDFVIPNFLQLLIINPLDDELPESRRMEFLSKYMSNVSNVLNRYFLLFCDSNYELNVYVINREILRIAYEQCIKNPKIMEYTLIYDVLWAIDDYSGPDYGPEFLSIENVYKINQASKMKNKKFLKDLSDSKITNLIYRIYATYYVFEYAPNHLNDRKGMDRVTKELQEYISTLPKTRISFDPSALDSINQNFAHDLDFLIDAGDYLASLNSDEKYELQPAILAYETFYKLTNDKDSLGLIAGRLGQLFDRAGNREKSTHYLKDGIKKGDEFSYVYYSNNLFNESQSKAIALLEKYLKTNSSLGVQIKLSELLLRTETEANMEKGRGILEKLSSKNYAHANLILGSMYLNGDLFGLDVKKAIKHLTKATKLGLFNAAYALVHMFADAESATNKNIEDLISLLENNVEHGSDLCKGLLAYIYTNGLGGNVALEPEKGISYLKSMKHQEFVDIILNDEYADLDLIYEKLDNVKPLEDCIFLDNDDEEGDVED